MSFNAYLRNAIQVLGLSFEVFLFSFSAHPQASIGCILGSITDQSSGAIAGATMTIMDVDLGVARTLKRNSG